MSTLVASLLCGFAAWSDSVHACDTSSHACQSSFLITCLSYSFLPKILSVCVCVHIHICAYMCACVCVCPHIHICAYMCVCVCVCVSACAYACACLHTCTCVSFAPTFSHLSTPVCLHSHEMVMCMMCTCTPVAQETQVFHSL